MPPLVRTVMYSPDIHLRQQADGRILLGESWTMETEDTDLSLVRGQQLLARAATFLPELAQRYRIVELVYDPWRAQHLAETAAQHRIRTVAFPQSDSRMVPASASLHRAVVEQHLRHPDDEKLNEHVAAAIARSGRRGWRIDMAERGTPVDGLVALCMAHESRTAPTPPPTEVLGWL